MGADPKIDVFETERGKFFCWISWVSADAVSLDGRMRVRTQNCDGRQDALRVAQAVAGLVQA